MEKMGYVTKTCLGRNEYIENHHSNTNIALSELVRNLYDLCLRYKVEVVSSQCL